MEDSKFLSHSNELYLEFDKYTLFNKATLRRCLNVCSSKNYLLKPENFTKNQEKALENEECMFNCANKFELATGHVEHAFKNHSVFNNHHKKFDNMYQEDKKVKDLINKLF